MEDLGYFPHFLFVGDPGHETELSFYKTCSTMEDHGHRTMVDHVTQWSCDHVIPWKTMVSVHTLFPLMAVVT